MKKRIVVLLVLVVSFISQCSRDTTELAWKNNTADSIKEIKWFDSNHNKNQEWFEDLSNGQNTEYKQITKLNGYGQAFDSQEGVIADIYVDLGNGLQVNISMDEGSHLFEIQQVGNK